MARKRFAFWTAAIATALSLSADEVGAQDGPQVRAFAETWSALASDLASVSTVVTTRAQFIPISTLRDEHARFNDVLALHRQRAKSIHVVTPGEDPLKPLRESWDKVLFQVPMARIVEVPGGTRHVGYPSFVGQRTTRTTSFSLDRRCEERVDLRVPTGAPFRTAIVSTPEFSAQYTEAIRAVELHGPGVHGCIDSPSMFLRPLPFGENLRERILQVYEVQGEALVSRVQGKRVSLGAGDLPIEWSLADSERVGDALLPWDMGCRQWATCVYGQWPSGHIFPFLLVRIEQVRADDQEVLVIQLAHVLDVATPTQQQPALRIPRKTRVSDYTSRPLMVYSTDSTGAFPARWSALFEVDATSPLDQRPPAASAERGVDLGSGASTTSTAKSADSPTARPFPWLLGIGGVIFMLAATYLARSRRRLRGHDVGILLLLAATCFGGCGGTEFSWASDQTFEAGDVPPSERRLTHEFVITNPTSDTHTIRRLAPSCCCMKTVDGPLTLSPHASLRIPVALDLGAVAGPFHYSVAVVSETLPKGGLYLNVRGSVTRRLLLSPPVLAVGDVHAGSVIERHAVVTLPESATTVGIKITNAPAWVTTQVRRSGMGEGGTHLLELTVSCPKTPGPFDGSVELTMTGDAPELATLEIRGRVRSELAIRPSYIPIAPGESGLIRVEAESTSPDILPVVDGLPPGLSAHVATDGPGKWVISVERLDYPSTEPIRAYVVFGSERQAFVVASK
jgi:hypothetical protein